MKNYETSQPSYKNNYIYYIKNPNILVDKIVEIYNANPNASVVYPRNKKSNVKLLNIVKKIENDQKIGKQYKEFVKEFRNIHKNTYIEYDNQTYKNLVLDRINKKEVSTSNDDSFIKEVGKKFNSVLKNTNINKLSKNEYHVYTLLNKYKNDNTNLLISSFLSANKSTDLYNTINKNLYNKLKNNELSKQSYHTI